MYQSSRYEFGRFQQYLITLALRDDCKARRKTGRRTINVAFEEEVGLNLCRRRTRPFPINFVLDIAHRDERSHDASPSAGLCSRGNRAIVDVFCGRYTGAIVCLREDESDLAAIIVGTLGRALVDGPGMGR